MPLRGERSFPAVERIRDTSRADERVLEHLELLGCDLGAPREVTHYLYVRAEDTARIVAGILECGGWHTAVDPCEDTSFLVRATRVRALSRTIVKETRAELEALAAAHRGLYDGWEARTG